MHDAIDQSKRAVEMQNELFTLQLRMQHDPAKLLQVMKQLGEANIQFLRAATMLQLQDLPMLRLDILDQVKAQLAQTT